MLIRPSIPWYVRLQPVFSKSVHQFFLKFCTTIEIYKKKRQKLVQWVFQKNSYLVKNGVFLSFHEMLSLLFAGNNLIMKDITILCVPVQALYLRKLWFTSYVSKCSPPIRLQDSLIVNISGRMIWILSIFSMKIFTQWRQHLKLLLLVRCLGIPSYAQTCMDLQRVPLGKLGAFSD